MTFSAKILL